MTTWTPILILGVLGSLLAYGPANGQASSDSLYRPRERPNIIVIMVDDMRVDDLAAMPNTRRLLASANGARYANMHVATPLCCPSRATFLTGQYSHHNGVWDNDAGQNGGWEALRPIEPSLLPVAMRRAGYHTSFLGKYVNGYNVPTVPPGWDRWAGLFGRSTYNYRHFDLSIDGQAVHVDGYNTWNLGSRAVSQIRNRASGAPLFMWLSFVAPHTTGGHNNRHVPAAPEYEGKSRVGLPDDPSVNEQVIRDKPPWVADLPRLSGAKRIEAIEIRRERRDALRSVDDQVQRVVAALRAAGELGNTIIMFTSDNGYLLGEHRITINKRLPYTPSTRVPLLIRGPGFTPGRHNEPVSNIDLAPTIMYAAGATPLRPFDGMALNGPIPIPHGRPLLIEHLNPYDSFGMPPYQGVRQGGDMYVEYANGIRELYVDDPYQQRNVAGLPDYAGRQAEMAAMLRGLAAD